MLVLFCVNRNNIFTHLFFLSSLNRLSKLLWIRLPYYPGFLRNSGIIRGGYSLCLHWIPTLDSRCFQRYFSRTLSWYTLNNWSPSVLIWCHPFGVARGLIKHQLLDKTLACRGLMHRRINTLTKYCNHRLTQGSLEIWRQDRKIIETTSVNGSLPPMSYY